MMYVTRVRLNSKQKINLIYLTYNSLTNFSRKVQGSSATARQMNLSQPTVSTALRRFSLFQYNLEAFVAKANHKGRVR